MHYAKVLRHNKALWIRVETNPMYTQEGGGGIKKERRDDDDICNNSLKDEN